MEIKIQIREKVDTVSELGTYSSLWITQINNETILIFKSKSVTTK